MNLVSALSVAGHTRLLLPISRLDFPQSLSGQVTYFRRSHDAASAVDVHKTSRWPIIRAEIRLFISQRAPVCLLRGFYILSTSLIISGWAPSCDNARSWRLWNGANSYVNACWSPWKPVITAETPPCRSRGRVSLIPSQPRLGVFNACHVTITRRAASTLLYSRMADLAA